MNCSFRVAFNYELSVKGYVLITQSQFPASDRRRTFTGIVKLTIDSITCSLHFHGTLDESV